MKEILEILDKIEFFQGQRSGRELWETKPEKVQNEDIENFNRDIQKIRDYVLKSQNTLERIVDRLEKLSDIFNTGNYNDAYCKTIDDDKCEGTNCFACVLNKASEVVKEEGGMNEKV